MWVDKSDSLFESMITRARGIMHQGISAGQKIALEIGHRSTDLSVGHDGPENNVYDMDVPCIFAWAAESLKPS